MTMTMTLKLYCALWLDFQILVFIFIFPGVCVRPVEFSLNIICPPEFGSANLFANRCNINHVNIIQALVALMNYNSVLVGVYRCIQY